MKWLKRILWVLFGIVVLLAIAGSAGFWYLTLHGGTDINEAGLTGRFYAAPGMKHHTAVLMLGGSNGGYPYDSAAQNLAKSGYPVFALAYFRNFVGQPAGLPKYLANIPLEYFFHAIDWMKTRPEVNPGKIVLMGESRGGELVLLLGTLRPDLAGVIAYSPSNFVWAGLDPTFSRPAWTLHGKPVPCLIVRKFSFEHAVASFKQAIAAATPAERAAATIPVEKIRAPVLLISSRSDNLWPASEMSNAVETRLKSHGFRYAMQNVQYRDASHLLMGYGPGIVRLGMPFMGGFYFGGSPEGTRIARDAGWAKAKDFLARVQAGEDRTAVR